MKEWRRIPTPQFEHCWETFFSQVKLCKSQPVGTALISLSGTLWLVDPEVPLSTQKALYSQACKALYSQACVRTQSFGRETMALTINYPLEILAIYVLLRESVQILKTIINFWFIFTGFVLFFLIYRSYIFYIHTPKPCWIAQNNQGNLLDIQYQNKMKASALVITYTFILFYWGNNTYFVSFITKNQEYFIYHKYIKYPYR